MSKERNRVEVRRFVQRETILECSKDKDALKVYRLGEFFMGKRPHIGLCEE